MTKRIWHGMWALILLSAAACTSPAPAAQGAISGGDAATDGSADSSAIPDIAKGDSPTADLPWPALDTAPPLPDACASSDTTRVTPRACAAVTPWCLAGKAVPAPTLQVDVGSWDVATGVFSPWAEGQWAPMHTGMRTGFGVWAVLAVKLPAGTADPVELKVAADGLLGCQLVGQTVTTTMKFHQAPGDPGLWVNADALYPGGACVLVGPGGPTQGLAYCGQWMTIRAQVGTADGSLWGEAQRVVRLYGFAGTP